MPSDIAQDGVSVPIPHSAAKLLIDFLTLRPWIKEECKSTLASFAKFAESALAGEHTRGWNEAIEAAVIECEAYMDSNEWGSALNKCFEAIRALRKPDTQQGGEKLPNSL